MPSLSENTKASEYYSFNTELTLNRSSFNLLDCRLDKLALAQTIQNILIINPGTFPNQPELGVGIENYLFEFGESGTIDELRNKINEQKRRFIPSTYNVEFDIKTKTDGRVSVLSIQFDIEQEDYDNDTKEVTSFQLLFGKNKNESKMVSKLLM